MAGFEDLDVWKRAVKLSISIYQNTNELRDFGFRDQITRSGLSVPSNIAEGMERSTIPDKCKFLDYARASCGELRTQTIVGIGAGLITKSIGDNWYQETKEPSAMINGLIRSLKSKQN
ncbi:MAG: four helix bundle protein [Planctomycetaceae bacterium]|nr:four helix bundle protein [Planctomycetaceae bacterium]